MEPWTIAGLLQATTPYLREKGSSSARLDAELLLSEALGIDRVQLYVQYDRPVTGPELEAYRRLVTRRARMEPVAHILQRAHFRKLALEVGPAVLIPRPETEELVDVAIRSLRLRPPLLGSLPGPPAGSTRGRLSGPLIADVGTGSGAIALSLAQETGLSVLAIDQSDPALEIAARNRCLLGLEALIELRHADLLHGIAPGSLRMVVANPPYLTEEEMNRAAPEVRLYEPPQALVAGPDGLDVIRRLVPEAADVLGPGGTLLMEVGHEQAGAVTELAHSAGFALTRVHRDMSHKERIVESVMPGAPVLFLRSAIAPDGRDTCKVVARALDEGAIIGVPTDTVYGLAARWDRTAGVQRLFDAKGRDFEQPVAVLFESAAAVKEHIPDLPAVCAAVLDAMLPGPYTFVVPASVSRPRLVGKADSLGVRVPDHPFLLALINMLGAPLAATSANASGEAPAATLEEVGDLLRSHCSFVFDNPIEAHPDPRASTIVDLVPLAHGGYPKVLREGGVGSAEVLEKIAAAAVLDAS